jgi:carbamoyltransferase
LNILGLHFGHDAGVAVIGDGLIGPCLLRERHNRVKHALSLDIALVDKALAIAGLTADDVDYCAICSTQSFELISDDAETFSVLLEPHPAHTFPSSLRDIYLREGYDIRNRVFPGIAVNSMYGDTVDSERIRKMFPEYKVRRREDIAATGYLMDYISILAWDGDPTLIELAARDLSPVLKTDALRHGFHYPCVLLYRGRRIPAAMIQHHVAHAASVYYVAGVGRAAILTHDGFGATAGANNGLFLLGERNRLYPVAPHGLVVGNTYRDVGCTLGFDRMGAAGKLMGLAPYGSPRFFDRRFVGNAADHARMGFSRQVARDWVQHCMNYARGMGYDVAMAGDVARVTERVNVDIAASTQKLFEETILQAAEALHAIMQRLNVPTENLCYAGGTALNCPANTRLYRESPFANVFIEPDTDDSGLAIGAALWLYHNVLDYPLVDHRAAESSHEAVDPFYGCAYSEAEILAAFDGVKGRIRFDKRDDWVELAATDIAGNKIIGWFDGPSEIGPRALGHRSILANACHADNWRKVNAVKSREPWRPFAPAVLQSEAAKWFRGAPPRSPYMLFTAHVLSTAVPAITHVDGSARLQTVDESCGAFFRLLQCVHRQTGVPMVLNTSFNGRSEPIVETPQNALEFLLNTTLDALYIEGYHVVRAA